MTTQPETARVSASLPLVTIRYPQPHDLVDRQVLLVGVGTGFEGTIAARVRDGEGREVGGLPMIRAGGTGIWGAFRAEIPLGSDPITAHGTVETYESSARDGEEMITAVVPVVFGFKLIQPFIGFAQHTVVRGDTLAQIAQQWYGAANEWNRIFEANRFQIVNPNRIFPGQVLRIPQ